MYEDAKSVIQKLYKVRENHLDCIKDFDKIIETSPKKLMSKDKKVSVYGMFYPESQMANNFIYKGKLTTNENKKDFVYYFDKKDRLILKIRCPEFSRVTYSFYYYYSDHIEFVRYDTIKQKVFVVGYLEYKNQKFSKFVESQDILSDDKIESFREYMFDIDPGYVTYRLYDGEDWDRITSKMEYFES